MFDGIVAAIQIPLARLGFDSNRSGIGMSEMAERMRVAILLITHFSKGGPNTPKKALVLANQKADEL
jgi:hypothetical protein